MVDDEAFNYEMLQLQLPERFRLHYVESGEKCLAQALSDCPDIILLDVCMPGLDGYDTCRLLKNTPETHHIPIIMVSGLETEQEKRAAFEAGCQAYLAKPYKVADLIEMIEQYSLSATN